MITENIRMDNAGVSAEELTGIAALLGLFGAGIKWLLSWVSRSQRNEQRNMLAERERLNEYRASLDRREKLHREEIEQDLADVKLELETLGQHQSIALALLLATRTALHEVTVKLRQHDPECVEIEHAEALLRPSFLDPALFTRGPLPGGWSDLLAQIDKRKK